MKNKHFFKLYELICICNYNSHIRKDLLNLRKKTLNSNLIEKVGFTKIAFDTRRIDQETEYNPRRGLQNYSRSEAFVSEAISKKIKNFSKLKTILDDLKKEYGKEPEWQDSNARILLSTLDKGLRVGIKDGDFAISQPAQGSLDYIEELLYVRYRLSFDDLTKLGYEDLKKIILSKDEELTNKDINNISSFTDKDNITPQIYDTLVEKLFGNIKATRDNKEVERTVTITIKDKFIGD